MPLHSPLEKEAFAQGVVDRPGRACCSSTSTATRSSGTRTRACRRPGSCTTTSRFASGLVEYNDNGWHDDNGHLYRITGITITPARRAGQRRRDGAAPAPVVHRAGPFFPRANQGDIVELTFDNTLGTLPADDFDLITPPVECGCTSTW